MKFCTIKGNNEIVFNSLKDNFLLNESNNNLLSEIEVLESDITVTCTTPSIEMCTKIKKNFANLVFMNIVIKFSVFV